MFLFIILFGFRVNEIFVFWFFDFICNDDIIWINFICFCIYIIQYKYNYVYWKLETILVTVNYYVYDKSKELTVYLSTRTRIQHTSIRISWKNDENDMIIIFECQFQRRNKPNTKWIPQIQFFKFFSFNFFLNDFVYDSIYYNSKLKHTHTYELVRAKSMNN